MRRTLAELLRDGDVRPVADVLVDAMATADAAMRDVRAEVVETGERDGSVPIELVDRLLQMAGRASSLAKTLADVGIGQQLAGAAQEQAVADLTVATLDRMRRAFLDGLALPSVPASALAAWWDEAVRMALLDLRIEPVPVSVVAAASAGTDTFAAVFDALGLPPSVRAWADEAAGCRLAGEPLPPAPRDRAVSGPVVAALDAVLGAVGLPSHVRAWAGDAAVQHVMGEAFPPPPLPRVQEPLNGSGVPTEPGPPDRPEEPDSGPTAAGSADARDASSTDERRWAALVDEMTGGTDMSVRIMPRERP